MGHGTTRSLERVLASCGLLTSAELEFVAADDVTNSGVLCALPALLAEGLLRHTHTFYRLPLWFARSKPVMIPRCMSFPRSSALPVNAADIPRTISDGESAPAACASRLPIARKRNQNIRALVKRCGHRAVL
jgi:hypothetical protein